MFSPKCWHCPSHENFARKLHNFRNSGWGFQELRVRSYGVIWIRISDPRSLRSWYIKGTDESVTRADSQVPLMHHDPSDLGSLILIQITPKERTLSLVNKSSVGLQVILDQTQLRKSLGVWFGPVRPTPEKLYLKTEDTLWRRIAEVKVGGIEKRNDQRSFWIRV